LLPRLLPPDADAAPNGVPSMSPEDVLAVSHSQDVLAGVHAQAIKASRTEALPLTGVRA